MEELHCTLISVKGSIEWVLKRFSISTPAVSQVFLQNCSLFSNQEDKNWKTNKASIEAIMCHPTTLFVSPKQGDILQSSVFLDLNSLMSLSRTCKAHAFDELSLIQLIENEITRNHQVMEFLRWRRPNKSSNKSRTTTRTASDS